MSTGMGHLGTCGGPVQHFWGTVCTWVQASQSSNSTQGLVFRLWPTKPPGPHVIPRGAKGCRAVKNEQKLPVPAAHISVQHSRRQQLLLPGCEVSMRRSRAGPQEVLEARPRKPRGWLEVPLGVPGQNLRGQLLPEERAGSMPE